MRIFIAKKPRELSAVKDPCRIVWEICDANPTATRQQILAKCLAAGICMGTASTQQTKWKKNKMKQKPEVK